MARNRDIFNAINNVPNRNAVSRPNIGRKPQGMTTREGYDPEFDANWTGDEAINPPGGGQQQGGPGGFGYGAWQAARYGQYGWENMGDAYEQWLSLFGPEGQYPGGHANGYGANFTDWWTNNQSGSTFTPGEWTPDILDPGGDTLDEWDYAGMSQGGGPMGGAGDLGWGSMFAGGAWQEGITNPFGAGWGPEGQYGEGGPSEIDPDWNPYGDDCFAAYQASGAVDDYNTWASLYC